MLLASRRTRDGARIVAVGLCLCAAFAQAQSAPPAAPPGGWPPLRLLTQEWPPYAGRGPQGEATGLAVDALRCVLNALQVEYKIDIRPWARAQAETHDGLAQGFFPASQSAARDAWAVMTASIAQQRWVWLLRADDPRDPSEAALRRRLSVTAPFGANMHSWLVQEGYRVSAAPYDVVGALRLVLEGRVDAALVSERVVRAKLAGLGLSGRLREELHSERPLGLYLTKTYLAGAPGFLSAFDHYAAACREDAEKRADAPQ